MVRAKVRGVGSGLQRQRRLRAPESDLRYSVHVGISPVLILLSKYFSHLPHIMTFRRRKEQVHMVLRTDLGKIKSSNHLADSTLLHLVFGLLVCLRLTSLQEDRFCHSSCGKELKARSFCSDAKRFRELSILIGKRVYTGGRGSRSSCRDHQHVAAQLHASDVHLLQPRESGQYSKTGASIVGVFSLYISTDPLCLSSPIDRQGRRRGTIPYIWLFSS